MGSSSMVVTGAELSLLQEEINKAISDIWARLDSLEDNTEPAQDKQKAEVDPDFDPVAEIPLKVDAKPAKKKTTAKKKAKEPDMTFEVE